MANNQSNNALNENIDKEQNLDDDAFEVTNQGQNLGGGKDEKKIDLGADDGDDFSKTDQSITQAAPGQTMNNTNQGGSNA